MIPLDTPAPRFVNRSLLANPAAAGRIAQRESVPFTRERSKVRSLVRPPCFAHRATHGTASENLLAKHVRRSLSIAKAETDERRRPIRIVAQSIFARFVSRMICAQRADSALIRAPDSAGVLATGSKPSVSRCARICDDDTKSAMAR
jgi:hypothetical protein